MRLALAVVIGSGTGCMHHGIDTSMPDGSDPLHCDAEMSLATTTPQAEPVSLDANSIGWCLHLDSTSIQSAAPIFWAQTDHVTGVVSDIELSLFDTSGNVLLDGWDVAVGQSQPTTFAELQFQLTTGAVRDVILRARATFPRDTTLTVDLDPGLD